MRLSCYMRRLLPHEELCRKLSRKPIRPTLEDVSKLLKQCYHPDDEDLGRLLRIIVDMYLLQGPDAVILIRELRPTSKFFLGFALSIYGLRIEWLKVEGLDK